MRYLLTSLVLVVSCADKHPRSSQFDLSYRNVPHDASARDVLVIPIIVDAFVSLDASHPECPSVNSSVFVEWRECHADCSVPGRHEVWCDKGVLTEGPCIPCLEEECNGIDDDCDDIADEGVYDCESACGSGVASCENGSLVDCTAPPVLEEQCNNLDDDCDTEIDENLVRDCYTGDIALVNVGVCNPGSQVCMSGEWGNVAQGEWLESHCPGETHPSEEVCDGADNDCDGIVDFGERIRKTDILFIVDWSSSMGNRVLATLEALERFSQQFAATEEVWWGLIVGPVRVPDPENPRSHFERLKLVSNISPFPAFLNRFLAVERSFVGGFEMLLDAVYLALRNISPALENDLNGSRWPRGIDSVPALREFIVNWRDNADRIIIVFSDEGDRTYMIPANTRHVVRPALVAAPNLKMFTFALGFYGWDELAVDSGGRNFDLSRDPNEIYESLMTILAGACQ